MVSAVKSCRYHSDWKNQCFWVTGAMSLKRSGIEDSYRIRRPFHGMSIRTRYFYSQQRRKVGELCHWSVIGQQKSGEGRRPR